MFVAAFLLVSAQAAVDQQAAVAPPASAAAEAPKKEKKICRVDDADSGSHMVRRICLTAQEWDQRGLGPTNSSHSVISGKPTDH